VIGEILQPLMVVVLNKIDAIPSEQLPKKMESLKKVFGKTKFGSNVLMVPVSAIKEQGIEELVRVLVDNVKVDRTKRSEKK
jgi:selenocysteine-specific elongation factor